MSGRAAQTRGGTSAQCGLGKECHCRRPTTAGLSTASKRMGMWTGAMEMREAQGLHRH